MAIIELNPKADPMFLDTSQFPASASIYSTINAFPAASSANAGVFAIANDTGALYCSFGNSWCFMLLLIAGA